MSIEMNVAIMLAHSVVYFRRIEHEQAFPSVPWTMARACSPPAPQAPDYAAANKAGVDADISTLPIRRMIDAAAQLGKPVTITDPSTGQQKTYDFTGYGSADVSGANADKMAQVALDIQKKYGDQFVQQAKDQLMKADPEGFGARQKLYDSIMGDVQKGAPGQPLADSLYKQIQDELSKGTELDDQSKRDVSNYVAGQQLARGDSNNGMADTLERAMSVGQAGQQRRRERQAAALSLLTSGATPQDIAYRQNQQNKANLSAFMQGTTPQAQFQTLSGAQNGAAPFVGGSGLPLLNPNAGQQGSQFALGSYGTQADIWKNTANPWTTGLGIGMKMAPLLMA